MSAAMLKSVLRRSTRSATASSYFSSRGMASEPAGERKVAFLGAGAAGGIGQRLSLLMKLNPLVSRRALYDIAGTSGAAADVSRINTRSEVKGYAAEAQLGQALDSATLSMPSLSLPLPKQETLSRHSLLGPTGLRGQWLGPSAEIKVNYSTNIVMDSSEFSSYAGAIIKDACLKGPKGVPDVAVRLGKNGLEEVLGLGARSDYVQQRSEALKPELKSSIENGVAGQMKSKSDTTTFSVEQPNKPTLRPLSPHLPIYKPHLSSTFSIYHRISGILLTSIILSYYLLCQKIGLVCLTYENVHQFFFYSSKLVPISLEITALALAYHVFHGIRHLLMK